MSLEVGTQLGMYTVVGPLGAGGMGEVYRATDATLDREVALKVLPDVVAGDPERVARFEREAKLLASLNHPQIAAIYGFEEAEEKRFLVLELVEGATLAERIAAGPLMVEESLDIARQITEALEAAHEKGIIHRDLKPANIKITPAGQVKVLDFGLAKALAEKDPDTEMSSGTSPTITQVYTKPGVILGTAAYMSPEQARGRPVDKRSDIFSFGCLLYEMLTGDNLFAGETVTDSLGAVLHKEPDGDLLPPTTPPTVHLLLRRCLAKDRKQRLHDIADARLELETAIADPTSAALRLAGGALAEAQYRPRRRAATLTALIVAVVALTAFVTQMLQPEPPPPPVQRVSVVLPQRENALDYYFLFDVSADGSLLVYRAAGEEGSYQLYVRPLDQPSSRPLPGTQGAYVPVFSPDAQWIAYSDVGVLKKISIHGGPPTTLCDALLVGGMTWTSDGYIVFCHKEVFRVRTEYAQTPGGETALLFHRRAAENGSDT